MRETMKMPLWGPYSKKYMGISHIVDSLRDIGGRFDFSVHPTLWNSSVPVPNVTVPSSYYLWECCPDYSYYAYRYELLWKDLVYADVSFSKINDDAYLMRCEFVNNTSLSQNCVLNAFASIELPYYDKIELKKPDKSVIIKANDYAEYGYAVQRPWDTENPDGMFKGMFRDKSFYLGKGLGDRCDHAHVHYMGLRPFGCEKGDTVSYEIKADSFENPVLNIRYRTVTDGDAVFTVNGNKIVLPESRELTFAVIPYTDNPVFVSEGGAGIELDFVAVTEENESIEIIRSEYPYIPDTDFVQRESGASLKLKYAYDGCMYNILTHNKNTRLRHIDSGSLEDALINRLSNGDPTYDRLHETFSGSFSEKHSDKGYFVNPLIKSIFIEPGKNHIEYMVVSKDEFAPLSSDEYEKIYLCAKSKSQPLKYNKDGEKYSLSTNIMKSTLLTNVVYPVFRRGENVIHHTPGKRWDSFYTWDSGFIGLGLLEFSDELCQYVLDTYLCDEDNRDFTFLLHGSLVPTQFYEYIELLKRTDDKHSLDFLYEKMQRYYEFLRGRRGSSTFAKFGNGLLTAYDYWYSCSGMDDYPAQVKMIADKAEEYSCPCLTTAQVIRAGKIMKMVAGYLGKTDDITVYDKDISESTEALNRYAWDEESGYYGYTMYDADKNNPYIMKTPDGENWDKGFDGVYPLVAGAAPKGRKEKLIAHIKNPGEMWSAAGISAVDMSASYYFDDGYWNGNVWMSHQWFVWKSMLDNGEAEFAFEIAKRALDMWKEETDFSYSTYECFGIKTRRGGWFHNFGGLSAPICVWADAYYKPGTVTTGFDVWTDYQKITDTSAEISFKYYGENEKYTILAVLDSKFKYSVTLDGIEIPFIMRTDGAVEMTINGSVKNGVLKIFRI